MSVYTYNSTSGNLERVAGGLLYADTPIGTVQSTFDTMAPTGWLLLQGQTLSRAEWTELFVWASARNLVGAGKPFGEGDGTTTFTLPDLRELVLVGAGQSSNDYDASTNPNGIQEHDVYTLGQFKDDQFQGHSHKYYGGTHGYDGGYVRFEDSSGGPNALYPGTPHPISKYGTPRYGTTTHGKQVGVNYIIKARQTAMPLDLAQSFNSLFVCSSAIDAAKTINLPTNFDKSANTIKVVFSNGHNCADSSTPMTLNGTVVCSNQKGTLLPLPIHEMTESNTTVYKCVGANTTLELYWNADYDGQGTAAWVVVGNPLVLSSSSYSIYANGKIDCELSDWENIIISTDSNNPTVMSYDGFIAISDLFVGNDGYTSVYIDGVRLVNQNQYGASGSDYNQASGVTFPVKKGQSVYVKESRVSTANRKGCFYKLV